MMSFRIHLQTPTPDCEADFIAAVNRSHSLHHPWVFAPSNHEEFANYIERIRGGRKIGFLLRRNFDQQLAGVVNISELVMGIFRSAYLGFHLFAGFEHKGYMTEGLVLVLDKAFGELGFHRLEANIQPGNRAAVRFHSGASPPPGRESYSKSEVQIKQK